MIWKEKNNKHCTHNDPMKVPHQEGGGRGKSQFYHKDTIVCRYAAVNQKWEFVEYMIYYGSLATSIAHLTN